MKILIVDDTNDDRSMLRYALEAHGHEVMEAVNGQEGLQAASAQRFDLIISDGLMPVMDGFQFLRMFRKSSSLPFIFYSAAYDGVKDKQLAFSLGANGYLLKPMDPLELLQEIVRILSETPQERTGTLEEDSEYLKNYSQVVVAKLEDKVRELESSLAERKRMEEQLKAQERKFRTLSENSPDSIIRYDLKHRILYLNNRLVQDLGLADADEVIGKRPIDIWPDGRFAVIDEAAQRAIATGEAQTVELVWKSPAGQDGFGQILVVPERDDKGCIVGTLAFGRDVTALKTAHERMELLEHAINHGADGVYLVDGAGRIRYCNAAASRALGYAPDELLQLSVPDIDPDYTLERLETLVAELDEEASDCFESRHRRRNGELFPVEIVASPVNSGGERLNLAIARDITERKQAEQKLFEKQQHLNDLALELMLSEEQERRRIAVDLHDTLGQDLTLTRMKLGSLTKTDLSVEQSTLLDEIKGLTENAINRVRSLTKLLYPPVLESAGLEAALKWLARQIKADYGLQIAFSDDLQDKMVAREIQMELYTSVRELLINIAKHADTTTACLTVCREADTLAIRVEDDGVGFEADSVLNGSHSEGFGLFTIKRRIMYMGGTLQITSKPGCGTEVVINVPLLKPCLPTTTTGEQP